MNIMQFFKQFPTEEACKVHFKEYRDKVGVTCKKCGCTKHYWLSTISYYKCKECGTKTSLKSGTVMEYSKLPYQYWYMAFMFATSTKKSFSALEIQRQIGHKFYEPIWDMMHKIRLVMGKRDSEYKLSDTVEMDEGFFVSTPNKENTNKSEEKKRGLGSQRNATVLVMAESQLNPDQTNIHKSKRAVKYLKMVHIEDHKASTINTELTKAVNGDTTSVITDDGRHYSKLKQVVKNHIPVNVSKVNADVVLPWVHKTISNAKRNLLGVHHSIGRDYIQNYLNEFCFKFNRRFNNLDVFDRLLNAATQYSWY